MTKRFKRFVAIATVAIGAGSFVGGIVGATYTYGEVSNESITVPDDANKVFGIFDAAGDNVRGPISLKAQADTIEKHTLNNTDGKRYAEMGRDDPVRDIWITSTALQGALQLGIVAYVLSAFAVVIGLVLVGNGLILYSDPR